MIADAKGGAKYGGIFWNNDARAGEGGTVSSKNAVAFVNAQRTRSSLQNLGIEAAVSTKSYSKGEQSTVYIQMFGFCTYWKLHYL